MEIIAKLSPEDQQHIADQIYNRLLKHLPRVQEEDQLLTRAEAAELLSVQPATVTLWVRRGIIPAIEIDGSKETRYSRADIMKAMHTKYKRFY